MKWTVLVFTNVFHKPVRTLLTTASLVIAFLLFGLLQPVAQLFDGDVAASGNRLIVSPKHSISDMLPVRYASEVAALPGVEAVAHWTWFGGIYRDPANNFARWAVPAEEFLVIAPDIVLSQAERYAFINTRTGAIIGRETAARFDVEVGDKIPLTADIWHNEDGSNWEFDLVGIFEGATDSVDTTPMYINFEYFDDYRIVAPGFVSNLLVTTDDPGNMQDVAEVIDARFANSQMETATVTEQQYALRAARQLGDIGLLVKAILASVFFTILLLTVDTMAQAIRERTREIGVLKSLGFTSTKVLGIVLSEALLMTLPAAVIGLALAAMLLTQTDSLTTRISNVRIDAETVLAGLVFALAVGLIAGLPPAIKAMRLSVAEALR